MNKKETFVFNTQWYVVLKDYSADTRFEVYEAIMQYATTGVCPTLSPLANMAFSFIKKEMDYNQDRYAAIVERRKEAGRKGAMSRQNQAKQANAAFAEQNKQSLAKVAEPSYNDNVNDNDNGNVNDIDNEIEKEKIEKENFACDDSALSVPDEFANFRQAYPGRKASAQVEFDNLVARYPGQWQHILPQLMPALVRMMSWREQAQAAGQFVPQFKNLRTWINQQCWTEEFPDIPAPAKAAPAEDPLKEEERRRRKAEADALDALRVRYERRVAPVYRHVLNFNQYRYLHFDTAPDSQLKATLHDLLQGKRRLPTDVREMFGFTHDFKPLGQPSQQL